MSEALFQHTVRRIKTTSEWALVNSFWGFLYAPSLRMIAWTRVSPVSTYCQTVRLYRTYLIPAPRASV